VFTHAPEQFVRPRHPSPHIPSRQTSPEAQVTPQPPQFAGSLSVLAHAAPHSASGPQFSSQDPARQASIAAQTVPQLPQLRTSRSSVVHIVPQSAAVPGHMLVHAPRMQVSPAAQATPQSPQ